MSHILVRQIVGKRHQLAGRKWFYEFGPEITELDKIRLKEYIEKKESQFSELTKVWDDSLNTEWTCRVFFASKMVLAASLMLANLEYVRENNVKVCIPYLQYYSLFYSLRAFLIVLPEQEWKDGGLITHTHTKTINVVCGEITKLDPVWNSRDSAQSIKRKILRLKAFRELISYRAPSTGGSLLEHDIDALPLCKVAVQLAQLITELLEGSLRKNLDQNYKPKLLEDKLQCVFRPELVGFKFFDDEDCYRIGYLLRKHPMPASIVHIMSEGHVEDFFGSWCAEDQSENAFDPDENWSILFDVP